MKIKKIALSAAAIFQMLTVSGMALEPCEPDHTNRELFQIVQRADDDTRDPTVKYTTEMWRVFGMSEEFFRFMCRSGNFSSSVETLSSFTTIVCSMGQLIYTLERTNIDFTALNRPILIIGTSSQANRMLAEFSQFLTKRP
jgi:hypothetical protein